jgi:predicted transcriptional regulator
VRCDGAQMSTAEQDLARRFEELERRVEELTRNHNELAGILRELVEQLQRDQQRKPSDVPRIEGLSAE